jgi:GH24 family phage-related lysozyme (muramidase)
MISNEGKQKLKLLLGEYYQNYSNFDKDLIYFDEKLSTNYSFFNPLDENRKIALFFICFKIGSQGLFNCVELLFMLEQGDYERASDEINQIHDAIKRSAEIIKTGIIDSVHVQQIST